MVDTTPTSCGREPANAYGALLADWHSLREALQHSHSAQRVVAEELELRGYHVEAARVRNQASGVLQALRHLDSYGRTAVLAVTG